MRYLIFSWYFVSASSKDKHFSANKFPLRDYWKKNYGIFYWRCLTLVRSRKKTMSASKKPRRGVGLKKGRKKNHNKIFESELKTLYSFYVQGHRIRISGSLIVDFKSLEKIKKNRYTSKLWWQKCDMTATKILKEVLRIFPRIAFHNLNSKFMNILSIWRKFEMTRWSIMASIKRN